MASSSTNSGRHPEPYAPPSALGDYAAQQANTSQALAVQQSYGPQLNRLPIARSGSLFSSCARRSRSAMHLQDVQNTGGAVVTPRQRADRVTQVSAASAVASGVPTEQIHMNTPIVNPGHLQGLPSASSGSQAGPTLIAGMTTDGNWSAPPVSLQTAGILPPLPPLENHGSSYCSQLLEWCGSY